MEHLHESSLVSNKKGLSTHKYVDVSEVRDGVIVLKSGALRSILLVSSVNFDLMSSDEQDAIVTQYQQFLNSLDFPLQILVSSRRFNIKPYLEMLHQKEKQQENELLRIQTAEYREFIEDLTNVSNIMSKFFYVVVPFSPVENQRGGMMDRISSLFNPRRSVLMRRDLFETYKDQLLQRVGLVMQGLASAGVRSTALRTEELIELLYNSYNPSLFTNTIVKDIEKVELYTIPH